MTHKLIVLGALVGLAACAPLLQTDFESLSGSVEDETISLPGSPVGDQLIFVNRGVISDFSTPGDTKLTIFRDVLVNDIPEHGEAYFKPIPATDGKSIFFSWSGDLNPNQSDASDPVVAAIKLKDTVNNGTQPNLFSKLTVRFGPEKVTAQTQDGGEVSIANSVVGPHGVILRIDPDTLNYAITITGDNVSPGGGFTHNGSLAAGTVIDPDNIGVSLTFADEVGAAGSIYTVDDVLISQRDR